VAKVFKN